MFSSFTWHEVMGPDATILVFWMLSFKPAFSLSSFTLIKRLFNSSLLSTIRVVSSAYLRLLIFLLENDSSLGFNQLAFDMIYFANKLNKSSDNVQPWHTPFPIFNHFFFFSMSSSNCCFLTLIACFSGISLLFIWFNGCWQLDLWFFCLL